MDAVCDLVLPCRDEAVHLRGAAARGPCGISSRSSVDNGSNGIGGGNARRLGATVTGGAAWYGAAVHAGLLAARREHVAFMDGDGS